MNPIKEIIERAILDSADYPKPYDRAVQVVVALDGAGYRIVHKPKPKDKAGAKLVNEVERMVNLGTVAGNQLFEDANDGDEEALLKADHNYRLRLPGQWCLCEKPSREVYFRKAGTREHGWMCFDCRRTTQTG